MESTYIAINETFWRGIPSWRDYCDKKHYHFYMTSMQNRWMPLFLSFVEVVYLAFLSNLGPLHINVHCVFRVFKNTVRSYSENVIKTLNALCLFNFAHYKQAISWEDSSSKVYHIPVYCRLQKKTITDALLLTVAHPLRDVSWSLCWPSWMSTFPSSAMLTASLDVYILFVLDLFWIVISCVADFAAAKYQHMRDINHISVVESSIIWRVSAPHQKCFFSHHVFDSYAG